MSDCTAACLITAPDFTYGGCGLEASIRSGFIKSFLALRCDSVIVNITDATEIEALIAAETLFKAPTLTGDIPFPTTGGEIVENCEAPQPSERTYNFNFTTYRVDNLSLTDFTTWDNLQSSLTTWTIAPVTCDNVLIVPQDFTTSQQFFSMRGTISNTFPNTNAMTYEGQLAFKYNSLLNGVQLSSAVVAALGL